MRMYQGPMVSRPAVTSARAGLVLGADLEVVVDEGQLAVEEEVTERRVALQLVEQVVDQGHQPHPEGLERVVPLAVPVGVGDHGDDPGPAVDGPVDLRLRPPCHRLLLSVTDPPRHRGTVPSPVGRPSRSGGPSWSRRPCRLQRPRCRPAVQPSSRPAVQPSSRAALPMPERGAGGRRPEAGTHSRW